MKFKKQKIFLLFGLAMMTAFIFCKTVKVQAAVSEDEVLHYSSTFDLLYTFIEGTCQGRYDGRVGEDDELHIDTSGDKVDFEYIIPTADYITYTKFSFTPGGLNNPVYVLFRPRVSSALYDADFTLDLEPQKYIASYNSVYNFRISKRGKCTYSDDECKEIASMSITSALFGITKLLARTPQNISIADLGFLDFDSSRNGNLHSYITSNAVEPTCSKKGFTGDIVCSLCGYIKTKGTDIPTIEHQWRENYTVDKKATCIEEGLESIHCSVCGAQKTDSVRSINKIAHNYGEWVISKDSTCTETGVKEKICSVCGEKITENIELKAHTWNENYTIDKVATCTDDGEESIHCSVCGVIKDDSQKSIEKSGHKPEVIPAVDPTCTKEGHTEGSKCSVCEEILVESKTIPAKGHKPEVIPAIDPTCTKEGHTEGSKCSVCEEILLESEIIPAKGHKAVSDSSVPASETNTGLTAGSHCSVCGTILVKQQVIPKLPKKDQGKTVQKNSNLGKKAQSMVVMVSKKTVKASKLKKKAQTVKPITIKATKGAVSYKITGGNKKSKKALKVNASTGKITVKKKTKKGTYKVKVTVTAAGNDQYYAGSKTVNVTVKVK